jgi:hypothetical protein
MKTKARILSAINTVAELNDYTADDCIYSQKYNLPSVAWSYILIQLAKDFNFAITDDFVDALEMCTFERLELLLEQHGS